MYDGRAMDVNDSIRAFFATRKISPVFLLVDTEKRPLEELEITHQPMKPAYENEKEYRCILSPILREDWKRTSLEFQNTNNTKGKIRTITVVERHLNPPSRVLSLQIAVQKTNFGTVLIPASEN